MSTARGPKRTHPDARRAHNMFCVTICPILANLHKSTFAICLLLSRGWRFLGVCYLFHELRHEKLVSTKLGRGPWRTGESSYVKICFKTLSTWGFEDWVKFSHVSHMYFCVDFGFGIFPPVPELSQATSLRL